MHVPVWVCACVGVCVCCDCIVHCYSLLMSGVDGVKGRLTSMLEPVMPMLKEAEFKGQEALLNELTKLQT